MDRPFLSVTQLTREIKALLEGSFPRLWVEGELSNVKRHSSGHVYFTLKDEGAQIGGAMWRSRAGTLAFQPADGMKVLVEGDIQVYEPSGRYQIIAQQMQPAGIGSLQMAFEQLKKRLHAEGLFEERFKKPLPRYPQTIGVITSPTGAALRDIISVLRRRMPSVDIVVVPVRVQGETAAAEIARAIELCHQLPELDVLIVGRGGGSLEDLWPFNEEVVARAIFKATLPIISAVGHETDFSIADFVADYRAPTPSAAAEIAVRDRREVLGELNYFREKLPAVFTRRISRQRERLESIRKGYAFRKPQDAVYQRMQRLDELHRQMRLSMEHLIARRRTELDGFEKHLRAVSPQAVLQRGYSLLTKDGKVVRNTTSLSRGDAVGILLADGRAEATIIKTEPHNE